MIPQNTTVLHQSKSITTFKISFFLLSIFFSSGLFAQTPGLIYKPAASVAGRAVLDPNNDGYTSATATGFSGTDYGNASELKMVAIPQLETEPSGDLATGALGGHTDMVDAGSNRKSVFVMSDGTNLIIRFRIGDASTASKGYSILIDTDNSFAGSGANPGFEQEIVLETGTNGRIAVYNHSSGIGTLSSSYDINNHQQRSVAFTTNNGGPDYFYDFYVPLSAISGSPVRFAAATITSAGSGITGTISDVNGVNDLNYNGYVPAMLKAVISSFPSTSLSTLTEGSSFTAIQTTPPYISSSSLLTTSTSVTGTSTETNGTTITVYKNGGYLGNTSVTNNAWTLSGIAAGTLSGGDAITAKAQDNSTGKSISAVSNTIVVGQVCTTAPSITGIVGGSKGYTGTWTALAGQAITANSVRIYIHGISAETTTIGGKSFVTGQAFTVTTDYNGAAVYVSANGTPGATSTWSFQLFNIGNSVPNGTYWATAENVATGNCVSNTSNIQFRTIAATATPVITSTTVYDTDTQVSGTKVADSKIYIYVNGVQRQILAATTSTSWTATGLNLVVGDKITVKAIIDASSGLSVASNEVIVQDLINGTSNAPVITRTYNSSSTSVTGTSSEAPGTVITVYKNGNSIGTTAVTVFGTWALSGVTLATNDVLTARALAESKNLSPASNSVTVLGPTTNIPAVNSPVYANSTSIGGTLASGTLKVYIDGEPLSPSLSSQSGSWAYSAAQLSSLASELYAGASVWATNTETGKLESAKSAGVTVIGVNNFLVEKAGGGNIGSQTAGVAFPVKITARDASNNTFPTYVRTNVLSSGSTVFEGSGPTAAFTGGIVASHDITLTKAGTYTIITVGTDNPSITGTSNSFVIAPAPPHHLGIFQQASASVTNAGSFPQQPVIYVYDQYNNHVTTDNTTQVVVSIASGTGILQGTVTLTAVNGIITYSGLNIAGLGIHTLQFSSAGLTSATSNNITVNASGAPTASSVSILGTTTTGQTLTGNYTYADAENDLQGTSTFRWLSSATSGGTYTEISGATASTYVLVAADQGKFLRFEVTPVAATGSPLTGTAELSAATSAITGRAPTASTVAISGTTTVGQTLTGTHTYADADSDAEGTSTFRWLSSATSNGAYSAISGATSNTYVLVAADQGRFIKFEVTPVAATGSPLTGTAVLSGATSAISGRAPTASAVTISGTTTVGQTLTGTHTYADADSDAEGTSTFRWLSSATSNGTYSAISGGTSSTYVLVAADQGKFIKFEVRPVAATGSPLTGTAVLSTATSAISGRAPTASAVTISGTNTVGQTLTGTHTYADADSDAEGSSTFRWLSSTTSGGTYTAISGTTSNTYVIVAADQGKFIKFEVTPVAATGSPLTGTAVLSGATSAISGRAPTASAVTISGTTTVGQTLTTSYTYTDADSDAEGTSAYRWLSSTEVAGTYSAISGATSSTYVLVAPDQGKFIKFEITPVAATGSPLTGTAVLSGATTAISGRAPTASAVTISGTTTVGQTLTGSHTYADADSDAEGTSTYRWLSSTTSTSTYSAISGATSNTYVIVAAAQGKFIKFEVTPVAATGSPLTGTAVLSGATTAITGRAPTASTVAISGTTTVGQTLTGTHIYADADNDAEGTSTFRWLSSNSSGGTYTAISGATSNTYVLVAADQGKFIKFEVTPVAATGSPLTGIAMLSTATQAIQSVNAPPPSITYSSPQIFTKGTTIAILSPLSTGGAVVSYAVSPALPPGLTLDPLTGIISGTPNTVSAEKTYTITAANNGGSKTFDLLLTVKDAPPIVKYAPAELTLGTPATISPSNSGGSVTSYDVFPVLPNGLTLDPVTGIISGTPVELSKETAYTVNAGSPSGNSSFGFTIKVVPAVPKLQVLLTASDPAKQNDGSFNVEYRVKIANIGNTPLNDLALTVDLNGVFPAPVEFKLLGVPKASGTGVVLPNNSFNGVGDLQLISGSDRDKIKDQEPVYFAADLSREDQWRIWEISRRNSYTRSISGSLVKTSALNLVGSNSRLMLNDTALVVFFVNIKPNGNFGPYSMNVLGVAKDPAGEVVSEVSTDGRLVSNTGITDVKYPTIVSFIPNPSLGISLNVQGVDRISESTFKVSFRAKIKNSGNLNLSRVRVIADLRDQFKQASSFSISSLTLINGNGLIVNPLFDGNLNKDLILPESAIRVGTEGIIDFTATILPKGVYGDYSLQLASGAYSFDVNQTLSNLSYSGLDPDKSLLKPGNNKPTVFNLPFPAPQNISLSNNSINENNPIGAIIGKFTGTDPNPDAVLSYTLVRGPGDADNDRFKITGSNLSAAYSFDHEQRPAFSIRVKLENQFGSSEEKTFIISIRDVNEAPTLDPVANQSVCYTLAEQAIRLSGISAGPETGQTTISAVNTSNRDLLQSLTVKGNELLYTIAPDQSGSAIITITVKDDGGIENGGIDEITRTFTLNVKSLPRIGITSDKGISISKGETLLLSASGGTTYQWTSAAGIISGQNSSVLTARPLQNTTYELSVTNAAGCTSIQTISIEVKDDYLKMLQPNNNFSPNGDGINDTWVVENVDAYPDHKLTIFDRGGRVLYTVRNYKNEWDGKVNGVLLDEGTYYYILQFDRPGTYKKGFITIIH